MSDHIAVRNPKLPGVFKVVSRRRFVSLERRGWVEAKSSEARAAVEAITTNTSEEA